MADNSKNTTSLDPWNICTPFTASDEKEKKKRKDSLEMEESQSLNQPDELPRGCRRAFGKVERCGTKKSQVSEGKKSAGFVVPEEDRYIAREVTLPCDCATPPAFTSSPILPMMVQPLLLMLQVPLGEETHPSCVNSAVKPEERRPVRVRRH